MASENQQIASTEEEAHTNGQQKTICDYEGSHYETDFWIGQNRDYEDRVERIAIRRLLPPQGNTLIDVGAGFGRLTDLYSGYERVILTDYSRSMLRQAQERLGKNNPKYLYVAASVYSLPFADAVADTMVMIRVIHHLTDAPSALAELARVTRSQGHLIIEFANKKNVKAILRYLLRRQSWNPFERDPIEFVDLNYNFHPAWVEQELQKANLQIENRLSVSHFRIPILKRLVPLPVLAGLDGAIQSTGKWWLLSPSGILKVRQSAQKPNQADALFRCPACGNLELLDQGDCLKCASCGRRWRIDDGLYDFKEAIPG